VLAVMIGSCWQDSFGWILFHNRQWIHRGSTDTMDNSFPKIGNILWFASAKSISSSLRIGLWIHITHYRALVYVRHARLMLKYWFSINISLTPKSSRVLGQAKA
jgi:hypothetical protein